MAKGKPQKTSPGRKQKLKVFRTPVGFDDAYVAAPSRKAALAAWGAGTDLFAAGVAELVTDPELTKEALERPGEVVRKSRGSADEQVAALGAGKAKKTEAGSRISSGMTKTGEGRGAKKEGGRGRRPSPAAVDRAEAAIGRAEARHRAALAQLKAQAEAIDKRRRELERTRRAERDKLEAALDEARERYRSAMEEWAR
ncbi:MAG TPA: hypothetical protein VFU20_09285 [Sphingomicrobium sp.]|nr:hypothetical protein [Sphingomicrobium sp.]